MVNESYIGWKFRINFYKDKNKIYKCSLDSQSNPHGLCNSNRHWMAWTVNGRAPESLWASQTFGRVCRVGLCVPLANLWIEHCLYREARNNPMYNSVWLDLWTLILGLKVTDRNEISPKLTNHSRLYSQRRQQYPLSLFACLLIYF